VTCIPVGSTRSTLLDRLSIGYLPLCEKTRGCEKPAADFRAAVGRAGNQLVNQACRFWGASRPAACAAVRVPGALKSSGQASLVSERSFSLRPPQLVGAPVLLLVRASGGKQIEQLRVGLRCE
jgi:hypothetical protein